MKTLHFLFLISILCLGFTIQSYGNGRTADSEDRRQASESSRTRESHCTCVQRGAAPLSAVLEDALAYALDIPLAMASPLTSFLVPPDEDCDLRTTRKTERRKRR
jgi:hypothetical protein